jgi:hypothetical protein
VWPGVCPKLAIGKIPLIFVAPPVRFCLSVLVFGGNMNNKVYEFEAEIKKVSDIDGAYVEFPYDIKEEFGKGRVKVYAEFNGEPYSGSIVNMGVKNKDGSVCYIIGVRQDIRKKISKGFGEKITVIIRERQS